METLRIIACYLGCEILFVPSNRKGILTVGNLMILESALNKDQGVPFKLILRDKEYMTDEERETAAGMPTKTEGVNYLRKCGICLDPGLFKNGYAINGL